MQLKMKNATTSPLNTVYNQHILLLSSFISALMCPFSHTHAHTPTHTHAQTPAHTQAVPAVHNATNLPVILFSCFAVHLKDNLFNK